ncbi:sensor histidine kinase [Olivibacter sitiensis]|uniref:sensor histidine kinase n=1 Tax=Olivibacter sitiensis TaxID=376470 RepID=UPI000485B6F3|nr:HAMP domain-containing sensor histidine kinase [Olivibacter sitiensis]
MKKRGIELIIGLMLFALLGVIGMQYYFIRQSYQLKLQLFDETINAVLNSVVLKAEKKEAYDFVNAREAENERRRKEQEFRQRSMEEGWRIRELLDSMRMKQRKLETNFAAHINELRELYPGVAELDNSFYETYIRDKRYKGLVDFEFTNTTDGIYDQRQLVVSAKRNIPRKPAKDDSVRVAVLEGNLRSLTIFALPPRRDSQLERQIQYQEASLKALERQANATINTNNFLESVLNEMEFVKQPLKLRIDAGYIVAQLNKELTERNIRIPYDIYIREVGEANNNGYENVLFASTSSKKIASPQHDHLYNAELFPNSVNTDSNSSGKLSLYFHNKNEQILSSMGVMLGSSAMLLIVLIACFAYTIITIIRQKKISEMKTDFINNMTHEFKTPVATIMIASESLKDPEISADRNRVNRLASIIYDENVRLGSHIERVLNIARIDKGNLKFDMQEVPINATIQNVVDSMELQLSKRHAKLTLDLKASPDIVIGDELHLSNVIFNLVDNAIKYSHDVPIIHIATSVHNDQISIKVKDNGIGMSKEQQAKIFDQFYRVSTGNLHDVKGFGLGLSYVADIIKRLKGHVKVRSEKDKGSEFEVLLPLMHPKED